MAMAMAERRGTVFCALETYLSPHTVLFKSGAAHLDAPVSARFGGATVLVVKRSKPFLLANECDV